MLATHADFSDVRGLAAGVAAAERAVTHRHNLLIISPSGVGPTMIARRIPGILPELTDAERETLAGTYARYYPGRYAPGSTTGRPFRAPHYSCSGLALAGEVNLAQHGVLYLDELPEFRRAAIECLAEKLEELDDNAPLVVASAAPCPCGRHASDRICDCPPTAHNLYTARLCRYSALLSCHERVRLPDITLLAMSKAEPAESSTAIRTRVATHRHNLLIISPPGRRADDDRTTEGS